ncbi:carbohydrate kinase family protein [Streptomyces sp. CL12]|uniref:carbohydrate kinase family protein n=1 Tax=Streptomyces sp. CL12 TaxID=3391744 RepID=UPI003A807107
MRIAVSGSIASDHLMVFPGRFTEHLMADRLDHVSLSFLADDLLVRHGGVAANIAYGLARLGLRPLLVGAAGRDFAEQRALLEDAGVDTSPVRISGTRHTARFVCTTDRDQNQIATFYAGAMAEAADIRLEKFFGDADFVLVGPDDPAAMVRHAEACRRHGMPFAADPSQQLARLEPDAIPGLFEGARYLFTNAYEQALLLQRTGLSGEDVLRRVGAWVVTLGADGVRIERHATPAVTVPAVPVARVADPTGAGDAFRAGFLAEHARGRDDTEAVRTGCALAATALESVGSQDYEASYGSVRERALAGVGR